MNDKKQLAVMGEHLSEQLPMCMAKRIEELEAQVEKLTNRMAWRNTGSPNGLRRFMTQKQYDAQTPGVQKWYEPIRYEVPEGWQLVPVEPTREMMAAAMSAVTQPQDLLYSQSGWGMNEMAARARYRAMIAAASPEAK